jgi:hypothetical protein
MSTKRSKKFGKASEMTAIVRFVMAVIGILMLEIVMMVICDVDQDVLMMNGWTSKTLQI